MKGDEPLPPPDPTLLATFITTLHPDNDDRDVLPPEEDDPVDCLQLSTDNIRNRIYRLICDSSSGRTGWTNTLAAYAMIETAPHFALQIPLHYRFTLPSQLS